nr:uncharacterized protein LOC115260761 [Aedes albopictus]
MSREKLSKLVERATEVLKRLMIDEIRGKTIHAKIDSAFRRGRSFFGINVQFSNGSDCIVVRHLALHEMIKRQTRENFRDVMVWSENFRSLVFHYTHDNGVNMVASDQLSKRLVDSSDDDYGPSVGSTVPKERAMIEAYLNTCTNEDIDHDLGDDDEQSWRCDGDDMIADDFYANLEEADDKHQNVDDSSEIIEMDLIESTRCAAHTAQLAVWDVLKQYKERLAKINKACIKMRHKVFQQLFHIHKYPLPPKVNENRWNVSYRQECPAESLQLPQHTIAISEVERQFAHLQGLAITNVQHTGQRDQRNACTSLVSSPVSNQDSHYTT